MSVFVWLVLGAVFVCIAIGSIMAVLMCMDPSEQEEYDKMMQEHKERKSHSSHSTTYLASSHRESQPPVPGPDFEEESKE